MPDSGRFGPLDTAADGQEYMVMTVDEYETVRLIDLEGMTQEECGEQMDVARSTVQNIYAEARRKLAESLVNGKTIVIDGGEYRICGGGRGHGCARRGRGRCFAERTRTIQTVSINDRNDVEAEETKEMKIAIPVDGNTPDSAVSMSFGRAPYFMIYDAETKESKFLDNAATASSGGAGIKAAQAVVDSGATVLLTPRCGENAAEVLTAAGVEMYKTRPGTAEQNVFCFTKGELSKLEEISPGMHGHGKA